LFQSLLYEAAGRTINPVHGAVCLLWTGSWHLCQAAVETVLRGGVIGPLPDLAGSGCGAVAGGDLYGGSSGASAKRAGGWSTFSTAKRARKSTEAPAPSCDLGLCLSPRSPAAAMPRPGTPSVSSDGSVTTTTTSSGGGEREAVLLNLFL
jgi:hypothetical protein